MNNRNEIEAMNIIINIQSMQDKLYGNHFQHDRFNANTVDELRVLQNSLIVEYNRKLAEETTMPAI